MVAAWSVDRLGRSLTDLLGVLQELHAKGVDLYLHQQGLDTSTPSGRAMFQMLAREQGVGIGTVSRLTS
jgi:DNA invertase Pin-like site-specific DNA recombinase